MLIDCDLLSNEAKVWVYPSSRKFYPQEIEGIKKELEDFTTEWKLEDENFKASYKLIYNRFIVFYAAEDTELKNEDIDKQVAFILGLQEKYSVELLDKMNVCFKQGEFVQYKDLKDFKKMLKQKSVSPKTIVFDNLIQTKGELENHWEVPITESWYNRFL